MKRIGEIIAINEPEITIEFYEGSTDCTVGAIISNETSSKLGIIHSINSVLIEEGKSGQAFGNASSTDAQITKEFPHLKNSLRLLAKAYIWHEDTSSLLLNQGIYSDIALAELLNNKHYWQTVKLLPLFVLEKHIAWLRSKVPQFNDDIYLEKLSMINRPLAWEVFLQQEK